MTIRVKIVAGFLLVFIVGLILGIVGLISTRSLTNMAGELSDLQDADTTVSGVVSAHYNWRHQLMESVFTQKSFTGSTDPNTCALGKWLSSDEAYRIVDQEVINLLDEASVPHGIIHTKAIEIIAALESNDYDLAENILTNEVLPNNEEVIGILTKIETRYGALVNEYNDSIVSTGSRTVVIILVLIAAAFAVSLLFIVLITGSVMAPIKKLTIAAQSIATGDLEVDVAYSANDQIGTLSKAFGTMIMSTRDQIAVAEAMANNDFTVEVAPRSDKDAMGHAMLKMHRNLNEMFAQINSASAQVSTGSRQVADGAQSLAQGSTQQASAIQELSASVSSVSDKTKSNSEMATKAAKLAETIKSNAEKGSVQMSAMTESVKEINEASQSINKVIKVIDDIAFQTNILALNAAVEAARAGQQGKGFAVVAEEVRNLAAKSAEAAKDTGVLIANSMEKAELGARIAEETAESLSDIVLGINESAVIVAEIEHSAGEQSLVISEINKGIEQVAQVISQNSATAQESAAASEEMSGQSAMLEDLVAQFKLANNSRLLTD